MGETKDKSRHTSGGWVGGKKFTGKKKVGRKEIRERREGREGERKDSRTEEKKEGTYFPLINVTFKQIPQTS